MRLLKKDGFTKDQDFFINGEKDFVLYKRNNYKHLKVKILLIYLQSKYLYFNVVVFDLLRIILESYILLR